MMMDDFKFMAVKVLEGDWITARNLADRIVEQINSGGDVIPEITKLDCDPDQIRVFMSIDLQRMRQVHGEGYEFDVAETQRRIRNWVSNGGTLGLGDYVRLSLYQFPKASRVPEPPLSLDRYLREVLNWSEKDVADFIKDAVSKLPKKNPPGETGADSPIPNPGDLWDEEFEEDAPDEDEVEGNAEDR